MQSFDYTTPDTLAQAASAAAAGAQLLAGGQSLLPAMKLGLAAPPALADLGRVTDLQGITVTPSHVRVGAMTTHADVASHAALADAIPALALLAGGIGDRQVRHRGTIGGSLAHNDPAACYPAAVLGLGATVHTHRRDIPGDEFFKGVYQTALHDGEIITAVSFPRPEVAAWCKFKQPASRFALVGVFVSKAAQGVRVAVTGAASCVFRAQALEARLMHDWSAAAVQGVRIDPASLNGDLHASAEYRAALIPVLTARAVSGQDL